MGREKTGIHRIKPEEALPVATRLLDSIDSTPLPLFQEIPQPRMGTLYYYLHSHETRYHGVATANGLVRDRRAYIPNEVIKAIFDIFEDPSQSEVRRFQALAFFLGRVAANLIPEVQKIAVAHPEVILGLPWHQTIRDQLSFLREVNVCIEASIRKNPRVSFDTYWDDDTKRFPKEFSGAVPKEDIRNYVQMASNELSQVRAEAAKAGIHVGPSPEEQKRLSRIESEQALARKIRAVYPAYPETLITHLETISLWNEAESALKVVLMPEYYFPTCSARSIDTLLDRLDEAILYKYGRAVHHIVVRQEILKVMKYGLPLPSKDRNEIKARQELERTLLALYYRDTVLDDDRLWQIEAELNELAPDLVKNHPSVTAWVQTVIRNPDDSPKAQRARTIAGAIQLQKKELDDLTLAVERSSQQLTRDYGNMAGIDMDSVLLSCISVYFKLLHDRGGQDQDEATMPEARSNKARIRKDVQQYSYLRRVLHVRCLTEICHTLYLTREMVVSERYRENPHRTMKYHAFRRNHVSAPLTGRGPLSIDDVYDALTTERRGNDKDSAGKDKDTLFRSETASMVLSLMTKHRYPFSPLHAIQQERHVPDDIEVDAEAEVLHLFLRLELEKAMKGLDERARIALIQTYYHNQTLEELGKAYGLTRERIRQILTQSYRKIHRDPKSRNNLREFLRD